MELVLQSGRVSLSYRFGGTVLCHQPYPEATRMGSLRVVVWNERQNETVSLFASMQILLRPIKINGRDPHGFFSKLLYLSNKIMR